MAQTHSLDLESTSSQYASISDASQTGLDITGDFTFEGWVKLESTPASGSRFILASKWNGTAATNSYNLQYYNNSGTPELFLAIGNGTSNTSGGISRTLLTGVWYHIAYAYDASAGTCVVYLNGKSIGTITSLHTSIVNGNAEFWIGSEQSSALNYFDGLIKDVRIFNDIRTQAEIVSDAHTENVSDANLQGEWNFNNAYTDSSGNGNTLTANNSPVFSTDIPWEGATQVSGSTYLETNLNAYWTLDEESGTRADSTANNNDLTDNNTVLFGTGKQSNAADFERANSEYLSIASGSHTGLNITGPLSIAFWVNFETAPSSATQMLFYHSNGTTATEQYYLIAQNNGGASQLDLRTRYNTSSGINDIVGDIPSFATGTWFHVVMVADNTNSIGGLYVNGVQVTSQAINSTAPQSVTAPFQVGFDVSSLYLDGLLDEAAIYSRALHYGDVLDLYNGGSGLPYASAAATFIPTIMMS